MTPEKHFEKFATEFTRDMEKSDVPFMLAIRPNVTDNPKFFVCAGYGSYIDHANMIAKFVRRFCEDADISVDEMRKLIDKAFDVMLALVKALNTFELRDGQDYDSEEFTTYAIICIKGAMTKYYLRKASVFKTTDTAFDKSHIETTRKLLKNSFSMDGKISDDSQSDEFSNFLGVSSNDYDDILFYTELERFLSLVPEEERSVMRRYYYTCIDYLDEKTAIKDVARHFNIPTTELKKIASRWNPELYAFLKSEKGSIEDFHYSYQLKNSRGEQEKKSRKIRMIKDGKQLIVNSDVASDYIANGWQECSIIFSENNRIVWINNGKVAFTVRPSEISKFESVGFVRGRKPKGKRLPRQTGGKIRITNGEFQETIFENLLEYWESVGYHVCECETTKDYVHIWKGTKTASIHKHELQKYLDAGWSKGAGYIWICNLEGEKIRILRGELQEYLFKNWIPTRLYGEENKDPNMILINYNGLIEAYVEKSKLDLYLAHGWKKGTAYISVYVSSATSKRRLRSIMSGKIQEYLDKGYTIEVIKGKSK